MATSAPASAKAKTVALPMPREPPVTNAFFPWSTFRATASRHTSRSGLWASCSRSTTLILPPPSCLKDCVVCHGSNRNVAQVSPNWSRPVSSYSLQAICFFPTLRVRDFPNPPIAKKSSSSRGGLGCGSLRRAVCSLHRGCHFDIVRANRCATAPWQRASRAGRSIGRLLLVEIRGLTIATAVRIILSAAMPLCECTRLDWTARSVFVRGAFPMWACLSSGDVHEKQAHVQT